MMNTLKSLKQQMRVTLEFRDIFNRRYQEKPYLYHSKIEECNRQLKALRAQYHMVKTAQDILADYLEKHNIHSTNFSASTLSSMIRLVLIESE